jgi:hypothetical protein
MHPKDWDNPGRVRVELKRNGRLMNPAIKTSAWQVGSSSAGMLMFGSRETVVGSYIIPDPTS